MTHNIPFENLSESDLVVDAIYEGGSQGHMGAEPIHKILPVGNESGFRIKNLSPKIKKKAEIVPGKL